jgi:hypothetical protein
MPLNNPVPLGVSAASSTANVTINDVIGNKLDTHLGNSLYAHVGLIRSHWAAERRVYPTRAAGATVVSASADWTYGAYATVVPANTITSDFHINAVSIESCNKNATFQLALYKGAADDIVTAVRFNVTGGFFGNQVYFIGSELITANSQVRARLASSDGATNVATIQISIIYLQY